MSLQRRVIKNARGRGVRVKRRRQWGTKYPRLYVERLRDKPVTVEQADTLWQHITVTFDTGVLVGDFFEDMRTIERIGVTRFGSGVSYNWCIDMKTGMVGEGMPLLAKGTHTVNEKRVPGFSYNQNYVARAFAFIGMPGDTVSPRAVESAAQLYAAMIEEGALTEHPDYEPHSLVAAKACPTDEVRDVMPLIEQRALAVAHQEPVARPEVLALREEIAKFLAKPRRQFVRVALSEADAALERIQWRR